MQRRKVLAGIGSLAAGGAAALGSGAFSNLQADREKTTAIRNDKNAYLGFTNARGPYASYSNGLIEFDFASDNGRGGSGLNDVADTRFSNLFDIRNQGTQQVYVWLATDAPCSGLFQSFECIVRGTDISEPGNFIVLDPGKGESVDFLFHVSEGGAGPGQTFNEDLQFRARDTSQPNPNGSCGTDPNVWVREDNAGDNDNDLP